MNIPVAKPFLEKEDAQAAYDTIMTQWVTQGPRVAEFESKFANYVGANYAVAVSNCTTALHLAMIVAGIERGDEVICPSLSYIATANSILYMGAKAVFAEVAPGTYNIDPIHVETLITPKTKAILIVHQVGMPADIDAFKELCNKHNLLLIEDAACAAGSSYKGKKIGSHSDLVCFSFHPRKVITTGDGGMITTNNPLYYERLKLLRQHGMSVNDRVRHESKTVIIEEHLEVGYNYRMTDFQAAVGIKQLEKLDWIINERRKIAFKYLEAFKNIPNIILPIEDTHSFTNYQTFWIYLKENCKIKRNDLMQKLLDVGIASRKGVMTSHREKAYTNIGYNLSLPISEDMSDNSIVIPLFVPMSDEEQNYVIEFILKYLA